MSDWLDDYYDRQGERQEERGYARQLSEFAGYDSWKSTEPDDYDPDEKHGLGVVGAHLAKLKAEKLAAFFKVFNIRWR